MKEFPAASLTRNTSDFFEAAPVAITKQRKLHFVLMSMDRFKAITKGMPSQIALDVADMPDDLGALLDKSIEVQLNGR